MANLLKNLRENHQRKNVTALGRHSTEESPDDLDKNHQVKVDAHPVM